jgi:hypothetical protein
MGIVGPEKDGLDATLGWLNEVKRVQRMLRLAARLSSCTHEDKKKLAELFQRSRLVAVLLFV